MNIKFINFFSLVLSIILVSGCAKDLTPGSYDATEVGTVKKVVPGVIISKRPINIYTKNNESNVAAMDNTPLDSNTKRTRGFEYVIKLNSGDIISIAQDEDLKLKVKQPILVIYGKNTRIVADEGGNEN